MPEQNVRLVDRVLDILETLSAHPAGITVTAIAADTSLNKSTVFRVLNTLMNRGYVVKDEQTNLYQLSLRLYGLGNRAVPNYDLLSLALPSLRKLSAQTHEAVHLAIPDGAQILYLFKEVISDSVVNIASHTGGHNYMYYTGLGKAILAYLSKEEVENIWKSSEIRQCTEHTLTDLPSLLEDLAQTRKRGYAIDHEEHEKGICCLASAVFNSDGQVTAAVSISTIASRMTEEFIQKNVPILQSTVNNISHILGYPNKQLKL